MHEITFKVAEVKYKLLYIGVREAIPLRRYLLKLLTVRATRACSIKNGIIKEIPYFITSRFDCDLTS